MKLSKKQSPSGRKSYKIGGKLRTGSIFRIDKRKEQFWPQLSVYFKVEQIFFFFPERVTNSPGLPGTEKFPGICLGLSELKQGNPGKSGSLSRSQFMDTNNHLPIRIHFSSIPSTLILQTHTHLCLNNTPLLSNAPNMSPQPLCCFEVFLPPTPLHLLSVCSIERSVFKGKSPQPYPCSTRLGSPLCFFFLIGEN